VSDENFGEIPDIWPNLHCELSIWRSAKTVQSYQTNLKRSLHGTNNHRISKAAGRNMFLALKTGQRTKDVL
jgi:hypothetical protein